MGMHSSTTSTAESVALSDPQLIALRYAWHDGEGFVFAGRGNVTKRGAEHTVNAKTIGSLVRLGYMTPKLHADGGMCGKLTDRGREVARVLARL